MDREILTEVQRHFAPANVFDALWKFIISAASIVFSYLFELTLPHQTIFFAIVGVCFTDWVLGISAALYNGQEIQSRKLYKVAIYILVYSMLLVILAQIEQAFVTTVWVVEAVMMPIILVQLVSILKNMSRLGLITNELLNSFLKKIDKYKDKNDSGGEED